MGQILIRNLDDDVIDAYRDAAARRGRSLEAEMREVLRNFRPLTAARIKAAQARFAELRAMTPDVPQTPSEVLVREDRDGYRDA